MQRSWPTPVAPEDTRGAHDLQIAATARCTGRLLLTTDHDAFDDLPGVSYRLAAPN